MSPRAIINGDTVVIYQPEGMVRTLDSFVVRCCAWLAGLVGHANFEIKP
jgi:hypothetical protein